MVPVKIETLVVGVLPAPSVIVLRPLEDPIDPREPISVLPIWISANEAASIGMAIEGASHPRPITHDLCVSLIEHLGSRIESIVIGDVKRTTFYAKSNLVQGDKRIAVDSRPSDAVGLAVRRDVPIFVDDEVLEVASLPYLFAEDLDPDAEIEEFHRFIESVTPDDFKEAGDKPDILANGAFNEDRDARGPSPDSPSQGD